MSLRKLAGYTLLGISAIAWLAVPAIPFIDWELEKIAAVTGGLIVVGEGAFLLAILLLGKAFWHQLKRTLLNREWLEEQIRKYNK